MKKINYESYIFKFFEIKNDLDVEEIVLSSQENLKEIIIINCPNLKRIVINSNTVKSIVINMNDNLYDVSIIAPKAKIVQLHQNKISKLKLEIPKVSLIDLTCNCLSQFNVKNLDNLTTLLLGYNKLQKLEIDYPNLDILRVDNNYLSSLKVFSKKVNQISCNNNHIYNPIIFTKKLSNLSTETPLFFTRKNEVYRFCKYNNINYSFIQKTNLREVLF